jgi:uncharacterized Zn-finger protein
MTAIVENKDEKTIETNTNQYHDLFICPFDNCGKIFKAQFLMNRHLVVHSQVKTHECRFCRKAFTLPQYLREHEYIHTKELPYACGVSDCTRRFRQAGKLSLHRQTHPEYKTKEYDYTLNKQKRTKKQTKLTGGSKKIENNRRLVSSINSNNLGSNEEDKKTAQRLPSMKDVHEYLDHSTNTVSLSTIGHDHQNGKGSRNSLSQIEIDREELDLLAKYLEKVYNMPISSTLSESNSPKTRTFSGLDLFDLTKKYGEIQK